jgi:predicted nucleic acid-binding protein
MLFAYALLGVTEFRDEAIAVFEKADKILVPDSFRAELANVIWQWIEYRNIPIGIGVDALDDADALLFRVVSVSELWERAILLSLDNKQSVYDTLFIALAEQNNTKVITYDNKLLDKFPNYSIHPQQFL